MKVMRVRVMTVRRTGSTLMILITTLMSSMSTMMFMINNWKMLLMMMLSRWAVRTVQSATSLRDLGSAACHRSMRQAESWVPCPHQHHHQHLHHWEDHHHQQLHHWEDHHHGWTTEMTWWESDSSSPPVLDLTSTTRLTVKMTEIQDIISEL